LICQRHSLRLTPILLFFAVLVASCDHAREPEQLSGAPAFDNSWRTGELVTTTEPTTTSSVSAVIGPAGGVIENGENQLSVPPMAVTENTMFTFAIVGGNYIIADLTARRAHDRAPVTRFQHPVTLTLSYSGAVVGNPYNLSITYLVDGSVRGRRQTLPSVVLPRTQTVSALLPHFSIYSMEIN
jgi:hypothetical protein